MSGSSSRAWLSASRVQSVTRRQQEDFRVEAFERELELLLAPHLDDEVEAELHRLRVLAREPVFVLARVLDRDQPRVGACKRSLRGDARRAPEDRQLGHRAQVADLAADDERFGTLRGRGAGRFGVGDVDDHRDAVALGDRLAEPALASHGRKYLLADRVPDGLELEERGDLPRALRVRVASDDALHVVGGRTLELGRGRRRRP